MADHPSVNADAVEVLLFDLGGVVFSFDFDRAFAHWGTSAGIDPQVLADRFERGDAEFRFERGEIGPAEFFSILRDELSVELDDAALEAGWNAIFGAVVQGVPALLDAAQELGFSCWALSNTNASHFAVWPDRFADVLARFEEVLTSHELGHRKPEPAAYRAALARIGAAPGAVLFFDDLAENVAGARRAGMQAEQVTAPDALVRRLRQLGVDVDVDDQAREAIAHARRQALAQLAALDRDFNAFVEGAELVNTDDEHDPEGATIAFERAQVIALRDDAARRVDELDRALARIEDGTYGRCVVCDGPIGIERLEALPGTDTCIRCAGSGGGNVGVRPQASGDTVPANGPARP